MKKYLLVLVLILSACSPTLKTVTKEPLNLKVGECIHMGSTIFLVTVVGEKSYGFVKLNGDSTDFSVFPKEDTDSSNAVRTDCYDKMREQSDAYLKSVGRKK
jgi:hypothetical protein